MLLKNIVQWSTKTKIKDTMIAGIVSGLLGVTAMDISNLLLWRSKKTEGLYGHLAGSMIMSPRRLNRGENFFLGQLFHMATGSIIGIAMLQILKKFGKDHHIIKGGSLAIATWGVLYNFGQRMGFYRMNPRLTKSGYAAIWHHLIYGITTSHAVVTLADPSIFSTRQTTQKQTSASSEKTIRNNIPHTYSDVDYNSEGATLL